MTGARRAQTNGPDLRRPRRDPSPSSRPRPRAGNRVPPPDRAEMSRSVMAVIKLSRNYKEPPAEPEPQLDLWPDLQRSDLPKVLNSPNEPLSKHECMIARSLAALSDAGLTYGVILTVPPWPCATWSPKGKGRSAERHYDTMTLDQIKALPIAKLASRDCALFLWATWPTMPIWNAVLEAWGFKYSGLGFLWLKVTPKATFIDLDALRH